MTTKPVKKHYDWSRAKMAHCGCGKWSLTVIFDCEPTCAACIDAHYTSALENHIDAQAARIAELEKRYEDRTPTQWAYDQACAALEKHRERANQAEKELAALREQKPVGKFCFEPLGARWHHVKNGEKQDTEPKLPLKKLYAEPVPSAPVAVPDKKERLENVVCTAEIYLQGKGDGFNEAVDEVLRLNSGNKPK